jgi:hypothetical protein
MWFGTSVAHVAALPGKLRLDEATYKAVQTIYYPGLTLVGLIGEFGGIIRARCAPLSYPFRDESLFGGAAAG